MSRVEDGEDSEKGIEDVVGKEGQVEAEDTEAELEGED